MNVSNMSLEQMASLAKRDPLRSLSPGTQEYINTIIRLQMTVDSQEDVISELRKDLELARNSGGPPDAPPLLE